MLKIEASSFGEVTLNGQKYDHDVVILPDKMIKRKKWITKNQHGTSHKFTREEMEEYVEMESDKLIDEVIIGTGQYGKLDLLPETRKYLEEKGIKYELKKTGDLVGKQIYEEKTMVIIHVTC